MDGYDSFVGTILYVSIGIVFLIAILQWLMPELGPETAESTRIESVPTERFVIAMTVLYVLAIVLEFAKVYLPRLLVAGVQASMAIIGAVVLGVLLDRVIIRAQRRRQQRTE